MMSTISNAAAQAAAQMARREAMKKGKTPEQKKAIDFLFNIGNSGCTGCLGSSSGLTMQDYLTMVQNKCNGLNLQQKALEKIGLDPSQVQEIPPIMLNSFVFDDDCLVRVEGDIAVSSQYSITWIYFSATQMYTYKYIFDTTSDNVWELTKDFFYTDITCFSTEHALKEKIDISVAGCLKSENIDKHHYVVDRLEIIVPGTSYAFSMRNSPTVEQSIQAAKAMLREKKYQQ